MHTRRILARTIDAVVIAAVLVASGALFAPGADAQAAPPRNLGHLQGTVNVSGTLNGVSQDGYWFYLSGVRTTVNIVAQSTNGTDIGSLRVWSPTQQRFLRGVTASAPSHQFSGELMSGWTYVEVDHFASGRLDYALTIATTPVSVLPDAGNTFGTARQLGFRSTWHDRVDAQDRLDYFRLDVPRAANGAVQNMFTEIYLLESQRGAASVALFDASQRQLDRVSNNGSNSNPDLTQTLTTGTYYIGVSAASAGGSLGTGYRLYVNGEVVHADTSSMASPLYLGRAGQLSTNEWLHSRADQSDMYRFDLVAAPNTGGLQGLGLQLNSAGEVNLYLLDSAQNFIANSTRPGGFERIDRSLPAGTYYALVIQSGNGQSNYTLSIANTTPLAQAPRPTPAPTPVGPRDLGSNIQQTATIIGLGTVSDGLGGADTADWFQLRVPGPNVFQQNFTRQLTVTVTGLTPGSQVALHPSMNPAVLAATTANAGGAATLILTAAPGLYDVSLVGASPSQYTLTASTN